MKASFLVLLAIIAVIVPRFGSTQAEGQIDERKLVLRDSKDTKQLGRYYALLIGNNDYLYLGRLRTAVNDTEAVAAILRDKYGFEINLLHNATRDQILKAINDYRRNLSESANLIIYYAGHGYYDRDVDKAYWLPIDADQNYNVKWISADDVTTNLKGILAKHILVISDSCYSGMLPREGNVSLAPADRARYLQKMMQGKSRTLMSSGGNEPVADGGSGAHSVFAGALLRGFNHIEEDIFTADILFYQYIRESVGGKSEQTPQYNPIRNSGHDSGDFVFVRKNTLVRREPPALTIKQLAAPIPLSPNDGTVFSHYPRQTTLKWAPVTDAASYMVELDLYQPRSNAWYTDMLNSEPPANPQARQMWDKFHLNKTKINEYTFNFVGAQAGRWRVWAVGADGRESSKSQWMTFKYTL